VWVGGMRGYVCWWTQRSGMSSADVYQLHAGLSYYAINCSNKLRTCRSCCEVVTVDGEQAACCAAYLLCKGILSRTPQAPDAG
jgi:hypothetical protein